MSQHPIMEKLAAKLQRKDIPEVNPGDTVRVQVKIKEGDKERVQAFEGTVISKRSGPQGSFTVRKVSFGQGVERIFPFNSKVLDKVEVVRSNQVRRAKLFYLRQRHQRQGGLGAQPGPLGLPPGDQGDVRAGRG